jgi:hypothetical protein
MIVKSNISGLVEIRGDDDETIDGHIDDFKTGRTDRRTAISRLRRRLRLPLKMIHHMLDKED